MSTLGRRLAERAGRPGPPVPDRDVPALDALIDDMGGRGDGTGLVLWAALAFGLDESRAAHALFGPVPAWPSTVPVDLDHMETRRA